MAVSFALPPTFVHDAFPPIFYNFLPAPNPSTVQSRNNVL